MKILERSRLFFFVGISLILLSFAFIRIGKKPHSFNPIEKRFAVVELFTSEGCSSCPSADAAIAKLLNKNIQNIYILSYHVDYWNRLGWKDEFSKHEFSERQQQYARYLSLEGVYTPQVIVNGAVEFVGSNETILNGAISNELKNGSVSNLNIKAQKVNNTLVIEYHISGNQPIILNIAIVLPQATTVVKKGENGGKTLQHVNIVRELKVTEAKGAGQLTMDIPKDLINKPFKVIAYAQARQSFKVTGADEVDL